MHQTSSNQWIWSHHRDAFNSTFVTHPLTVSRHVLVKSKQQHALGKVTKKQTHTQTFQRPWNHIFEGTGSILKTLILPVSFLRWGNIWSVQNQFVPKGTTFRKFPSCIERIPFQNSFCTNNQGTCTWTVRLARVSPTCQMNPSKNFQIP